MAITMNNIVVLGYVGKDPNLFQSGACTFSVATNEPRKDSDTPVVSWFSCVAWGDTAKMIAERVHKGDLLHVQGRLKQAEYTNKEGHLVTVLELHVARWSRIEEAKRDGGPQQ